MAQQRFELDLEFTHPYRRTRLYIKGGRAFFGRWHPFDVQLDGDEDEHVVQEGTEGQLDLIAHEYYGDRRLWRVIAHANRIDFPLEDVRPGTILVIPKIAYVNAALLQTVARGAQVTEEDV